MKHLRLYFEDSEFRELETARQNSAAKSWEKFILEVVGKNAMQK